MRYLVGFVLVVAACPLSVSAQEGEEGAAPRSVEVEPIEEAQSSQSWLERMHPGAFEAPGKKPDSGVEMEYVPVQSQPHAKEGRHKGLSRGGKIAVGVLVPFFAVAIGAGVGIGVNLMKSPLFGD